MGMMDYSRHFVMGSKELLANEAETVFYKHFAIRPCNTKTRGFMDLADAVGFGVELLEWMYSRKGMGNFYIVRPGDNSEEVGEVLFTHEDDSIEFVTKFLPGFKRPVEVEGNYWMDAWPCMDEYHHNQLYHYAPADLWVYPIETEHSEMIFETAGCDSGTLTHEGIQLWLSIRKMPLKARFYYWDKHFRFENEADMVLFAVFMDDWKRKYQD